MSKKQQIEVDGREVTISNVEKVYFPGNKFTKGQVLAFYSDIAETILPHLENRPLTLKRYPDGMKGEHFYEKNAPVHTPEWVERFAVGRSEGEGEINYVLCNDRATLVWVCNLGDIEKHVLLARVPTLDAPTSIVFDLDPGEPATIIECGVVALHLKRLFERLNLESFVKVSGSKGLHLTVPLNNGVTYDTAQPFAKAIAELVEQQLPDLVVSAMAKTLRKGKILIDWSQNSEHKTTVSVYAMRAKHEEPFISMPVTWEELAKAVKRKDHKSLFFTPQQSVKRIKKMGDLYAPVLTMRQELPKAFSKALAAGPKPKLSRWPRNTKKTEVKDKSLREYAAKRDHSQTPEPAAKLAKPKEKDDKGVHRFVIQKHDASHLHYDWRLEMQGVLRSWAVPKGPPLTPRETRLAMHVEDHPIEYENFEGTIPAGNYGAGTVMVWDQGTYEDITGNPTSAFYQGKMHIVMKGKKLKGEWILVKDRRDDEGRRWLLIKAGKELKLPAKADDTSSISGRSMAQIAKANDRQWQSNRSAATKKRKSETGAKRSIPQFVEPMQCKPVSSLPEGDEWSWELKFDGYRCMAIKNGGKVSLMSRNEKSLGDRFAHIAKALTAIQGDFAIDGEIVALDADGKPAFQLLQNSRSRKSSTLFYAFDIINDNGKDLQNSTHEERRSHLSELLADAGDPLRLSPLIDAPADQILDAVQKLGLEGVVGKRKNSLYESGERTGAWIKQRVDRVQEVVIGGFTPYGRNFESLIVGVYEGKELHFVAKVKNGFVPRIRNDVFAELKPLIIDDCPFSNLPEAKGSARWGEALTAEKMKECRWLKPHLVCQVGFVEWTEGGRLRHSKFLGMRDDKSPSKVVRET